MAQTNQQKQSYQAQLRERAAQFCDDGEFEPEQTEALHEFIRDETLRSYKNGLAAGGKQKRAPRNRKGSALENGKLQRVQRSAATIGVK